MQQGFDRRRSVVDPTRPRTIAGGVIRALGLLIGSAAILGYAALMWQNPPDWQHMRFREQTALFIALPAALLIGPAWLFGWIASFFDKRPPLDDGS